MGIDNKNELQTHQGMDLRYMQKSTLLTKLVLGDILLSIKIGIDDKLTCNVNKVYMYMILVMRIYAFLITMGLFI